MIITLLSDLGTGNASVSVAKAILMRHVPGVNIVDITHLIPPYNLHNAAYVMYAAYAHFPKGTVHIALVDVFSEHPPRMLVAEKDGYFFIAPDNGTLQMTFDTATPQTRLCFSDATDCTFTDWIEQVGLVLENIFKAHGEALPYPEFLSQKSPRPTKPRVTGQGIECYVMYVDRFENVVLGINREQFDELVGEKQFRIEIMGSKDINKLHNSYNDVRKDETLCRFNDAGFLEIAVNHGSALHKLGLNKFSPRELYYKTIKIFVEPK